jgi:hypothetical protein
VILLKFGSTKHTYEQHLAAAGNLPLHGGVIELKLMKAGTHNSEKKIYRSLICLFIKKMIADAETNSPKQVRK